MPPGRLNSKRDRYGGLGSEDDDEDENRTASVNTHGLDLKQLRQLKDCFQDEYGQPIKLNVKQFVEAMSAHISVHSTAAQSQMERVLATLFKKIDASCSDSVDWEEFTNYMLLHMPGFNPADGTSEFSHATGLEALAGAWASCHADMIECVIVVPDIGSGSGSGTESMSVKKVLGGSQANAQRRYITAGRDGLVKVWHPNLLLHKAIDVGQYHNWLPSCCWMKKSGRLAVASSNFRINFYDSSFGSTPIIHIAHTQGTPLCLEYIESQPLESNGIDNEILAVGDGSGFVTVYLMDENWTDQGTRPGQESKAETDQKPLKFKAKPVQEKYHSDWVTKVGFVPELQSLVTSGLDAEINLLDVHKLTRKPKGQIQLHKKGVHTWCWCRSYKFFASGGLDRHIIIWNPFTQKAMSHLPAHNAPVKEVLMNEAQHQLISMSVDKVVKVWDIRNYRCIQTFTDKTEYKPEDRLTCMAFDEDGQALVMCSSNINVLPVSVKEETSRTHAAPIVGALYNDVFNQIISGDTLGTVCVWDVLTGKLEFDFKRVHQDHKLTCMAFDESKRRLYTGAEDGCVKLWNFSSGQQLRTYVQGKNKSEITRILWAREGPNIFVVGLAWDRRIYIWPDSKKQTVEPQIVLEDFTGEGHVDDVSSIVKISNSSGLLATGGDDGYIVFWKIQEHATTGTSARRYRLCDNGAAFQSVAVETRAVGNWPSGAALEPKGGRRKKPPVNKNISISQVEMEQTAPGGFRGDGGLPAISTATPRDAMLPTISGRHQDMLGNKRDSATCADKGQRKSGEAVDGDGHDGGKELVWQSCAELRSLVEQTGVNASGVRTLMCLDHKDCLISAHHDGKVRLWSTKKAEFLQRLELLGHYDPAAEARWATAKCTKCGSLVIPDESSEKKCSMCQGTGTHSSCHNLACDYHLCEEHSKDTTPFPQITCLLSDEAENRWLFTGDSYGYVRVWDMSNFQPGLGQRYLHVVQGIQELRPHKQSITFMQYFQTQGREVVMTASSDCTVALSTLSGDRIGTFSGGSKAVLWQLEDGDSWRRLPPLLDDGPRLEDDAGWGLSPRRGGKGGGLGRRPGGAIAGPGGAGMMGMGMRKPRGGQVNLSVTAPQIHGGAGIFKKLTAVERNKPDLLLVNQEKQRLERAYVR